MNKKLLIAFTVIFFLITISIIPVLAREGLDCGVGPIRNVEVKIGKYRFYRPYADDDFPQTDLRGPFQVSAKLLQNSGVASVDLTYRIDDSSWVYAPMTIDGLDLSYDIPKLRNLSYGMHALHFIFIAYNDQGDRLWLEEVPYTCNPYTAGDPFYFWILVNAPFKGTWIKVDHQPRYDPQLHIQTQKIQGDNIGVYDRYFIFETGPKGNITVDPGLAELISWDTLEIGSMTYEYDQNTGFLHELSTGNVYRKRSITP